MKRNFGSATLTILALAILLAGLTPVAHSATCSTATVAGTWGFTLTGTAILPGVGPVPVAAVGRFTTDLQGNGVGTEARSVGGDYADETITGKWTVNADCTGTLTANIYENGNLVRVSVTSVVFDDNSKEFRMVQKSLTLPDGTPVPVIITLDGRRHRAS